MFPFVATWSTRYVWHPRSHFLGNFRVADRAYRGCFQDFWGDVYGELQRTGNEAKAMGVVVKGKSFGSIIASEIFTVGFSTPRTNSPAPSSASSSTPEAALQ